MALVGAALLATTATAQQARLGEPDIAAVRDYVEKNRSYSPGARAEALGRVARLSGLVASPARFELEVAHIAALADNGHSALLPPQWTTRYPRSPVHLGLFADGLFVIAAPGQAGLVGRPVLEINGRGWQTVRETFSRYQGGEQAFRDQFVTYFMETPALLAAAGLGENPDRLSLTLGGDDGRQAVVEITPALAPLQGETALLGYPQLLEAASLLPPAERPLYLQDADLPQRLLFPGELDGAYIQLKATRGRDFSAFLESTLAELRRRRPRNIVLDLRFNLGGDLTLARTFMQALPALARGGRLYAITSGRTFSAAISSLGYLRQAAGDRLVIVGEPIGDRLEFWAEGDIMQLPGLGALLLYATERHNYTTGCPEPDCHANIRDHPIRVSTLEPDLPAPMTFAAFRAGRDPAMEAVLARIGGTAGR